MRNFYCVTYNSSNGYPRVDSFNSKKERDEFVAAFVDNSEYEDCKAISYEEMRKLYYSETAGRWRQTYGYNRRYFLG